MDANYAAGEFRLKLFGWTTERRFVVIRERERESRATVGRKLIDVPGYTFRIFVTLGDHPKPATDGHLKTGHSDAHPGH